LITVLTARTISRSEPEIPSKRQKACKGAVRKQVNRLPLGRQEESTALGIELGDRSIAGCSPFAASFILCPKRKQIIFNMILANK